MGEMAGGDAAETEYICPAHDQELLAIKTVVHPDGSDVLLTLHTTRGSINLTVALEHISAALAEIRQASLLMFYRQTTPGACTGNPIARLLSAALEPSRVSVVIDPATADRLFIHQFPNRMPIITRMSPDAVLSTIDELSIVARKAAN